MPAVFSGLYTLVNCMVHDTAYQLVTVEYFGEIIALSSCSSRKPKDL
jgi:hypothetical protein